jgi:hypothetical protein
MTFPTNADRAERVRQFVIDYAAKHDDVDAALDTIATDVIADILHLVNLEGRSPSEVWESAYYTHYLAEVEEENQ